MQCCIFVHQKNPPTFMAACYKLDRTLKEATMRYVQGTDTLLLCLKLQIFKNLP